LTGVLEVPPLYGLDIETDTTVDGLDPRRSAIVAVAVAGPAGTRVFAGTDETAILDSLDRHLAGLEPGVVVTWNGAAFDLPFIHDRATGLGVRTGLRLGLDPRITLSRGALPGHAGAYRGAWHGHDHLDAYRLYRDVGRALLLSCSLKTVARFFGLDPVEVDSSRIHELPAETLARYVASDAATARCLARLRWHRASAFLDGAHHVRLATGRAGAVGATPA
jgi:uncharacterized protein YprB with RNaseH-like and TPR domain